MTTTVPKDARLARGSVVGFLLPAASLALPLAFAGCSKSSGAGSDGGTSTADGASTDAPISLLMGHDSGGSAPSQVPTTCDEATTSKSYYGCEFWPTVTSNPVWSIFDFAAVVANAGSTTAMVTVTGPNGVNQTVSVAPSSLTPIYLPWVTALKGADQDSCGNASFPQGSIVAPSSAYHLVSSVPVSVYQFNALEYQGKGGAPGKDWSSCPGSSVLCHPPGGGGTYYDGCYSFTNDASLLLPTSAMTGNYRITGIQGSTYAGTGSYFAITATADGTNVTVTLSSTAFILAGGTFSEATPGQQMMLPMNAGDVIELLGIGEDTIDLSGSLVHADHPIQVISGADCRLQPDPVAACDHLESSVLPAETLGKDYVVTVPTSPHGKLVGHVVRFFGNADDTTLTYSPSQPPGCPSMLHAGQVVQCTGTPSCATGSNAADGGPVSVTCVDTTFEVTGNHEFAVSSFMLGGSAVDPEDQYSEGDPSMSPMVATEQFLTRYIFLAPNDYDESYVDIVAPPGAELKLDGAPLGVTPEVVNSSWSVYRAPLGPGQSGAHILSGNVGFGVQVIGYGAYTSYQYPGGLNLALIAPPPLK
jgi:hypothetical protein